MVEEKYSVEITSNTFASKKKPTPPSPSMFSSLSPGRRELPIPPEQRFLKIFFLEEKEEGEDYRVEKITKINKTIGYKI